MAVSILAAADDGRKHFLGSACDDLDRVSTAGSLPSTNFMDLYDQSSQGSDLSPQDACHAAWMTASDQSADWPGTWADPHWQGAGLAPEWSSAWGSYHQQQWTAAFLSSSQSPPLERSWAGLDPMSVSLASEVLAKPAKAAPSTMQWTEMSLDPVFDSKPTTPANKSTRTLARNMGGSDVKLPPPVGSGRNKSTPSESGLPGMVPYAGSEGGQLWKGLPVKLSTSPPAPSRQSLCQPLESAAAAPEQPPDPISRLAAGLPIGFPAGVAGPLPSLAQPPPAAQTGPRQPSKSSTSSSGSSEPDAVNVGGLWPRAQHVASPIVSAGQGITTVMVRNVPGSVKQSSLIKELEDTGFGGLFDFCYLPSAFDTGKNKGYAFVNFIHFTAYGAFVKSWHGSRRFNARAADPALNVSAAALQGLDKNIEKWDAPRMRRVRNPEYRPFVVKNGRMDSAALAPPSDDEAGSHRDYASALELPSGLLSTAPPGLALPQGFDAEMPPPGLSLPSALTL